MTIQEIVEELHRRLDWRARAHPEPCKYTGETLLRHVPSIKCADGFTMSVQASRMHYCTPRMNQAVWSEVEVGFPSARAEQLMPYAECPSDPTRTVYGYVPIEVVAEIIADHGGFAAGTPTA